MDFIQWPAMVVTVAASWLVASAKDRRRNVGFHAFLVSSVLWIAWGLYSGSHALIVLQFCSAAMNIRGAKKSEQ